MNSRIVILLAVQRSGTNFLRGVLGSHPGLVCFPEIFQDAKPGEIPGAGYHFGIPPFWDFFRDRLRADPLVGLPGNRAGVAREYFEKLTGAAAEHGCSILVDVKYNSLHHMDHLWRGPTAPPEMLKYFAAQEFPIIHQVRTDPVRVAVSLLHARETSQYVARGDQSVRNEVISPDPREFHNLLRLQIRNRKTVKGWLRRCPKVLEVHYENLLDPGDPSGLRPETFGEIQEFLGLERREHLSPITKRTTARPLREVLGNFDEIQKRLAGTEFECYLDDSAGPQQPGSGTP